MGFVSGKTYRFTNNHYQSYALNVYGTNAASTGRNICLFEDTPSDVMQDWVVKENGSGYRLHSAVNDSFVLDCSDGSLSNSYKNNAHLCATSQTSTTDSRVEFEYVSDNVYKIYLPGKNLYLTATNTTLVNGLPASSISNATALKGGTGGQSNVYWATESSSDKQEWIVSPEVDGGSSPDPGPENPYENLGWRYVFRKSNGTDDVNNADGDFCYDPSGSVPPEYHKHKGIDVICPEGTNLYSPASGKVVAYGGKPFVCVWDSDTTVPADTPPDGRYQGGRGYFVVLEMDQKDPVTNKTMYIRYLHMRSLPNVYVGKRVTSSTLLGQVGNTGASDTAHLHLDITTMPLSSAPWHGDNQTASNMINPVNFFPEVQFPSSYYVVNSYI